MKPFSPNNKIGRWIMSIIQHYDHSKYWHRREILTDSNNNSPLLLKLYYLFYIKRTDARHNCSFGTNLNAGAYFKSPPILWHGPNGIIVGHDALIGHHCTIYHQVTISQGGGGNW